MEYIFKDSLFQILFDSYCEAILFELEEDGIEIDDLEDYIESITITKEGEVVFKISETKVTNKKLIIDGKSSI